MSYGKQNYAFEQDRSRSSIASNNSSYDILNVRLKFLMPYFEQEGFEVANCTPNSGLRVFPYVEYEQAIQAAVSLLPDKVVTAGMYDRIQRERGGIDQLPQLPNRKKIESSRSVRVSSSHGISPSELPEFTLVTAVDQISTAALQKTYPTWTKLQPWLSELPMIVLHDSDMNPNSELFEFLSKRSNLKYISKSVDKHGHWRDRWTRAYFEVPAEHVTTPWYLKLEPEAISSSNQPWVFPHWFEADESGTPVHVSCPWNYTRPSTAISDFDD